ncbi:myelin P2 protein isoform X2 [Anolis carolinensis]|uniref:myelin P2 protein isoform X2 n=1 Tax=Anolis carolinensis TaxID=28377 RepID=UPI002F2B1BEC
MESRPITQNELIRVPTALVFAALGEVTWPVFPLKYRRGTIFPPLMSTLCFLLPISGVLLNCMVCKMCERFEGTWELMSDCKDDGGLNVTFYAPRDVDIIPSYDVDITRRDLKRFMKPRITIRAEGIWLNITTENAVKKSEISFKLGQEFEETTADNRKTKSIVTIEKDGSLLHVQNWHGKQTLIRRKLVYGTMVEGNKIEAFSLRCTIV